MVCGALRVAVALLCVMLANHVAAQVSGDVQIVSDYRYRGVSLSEGQPEAQVGLNYDGVAGWYVGGLASGANLDGTRTAQVVAYGGYAGPISDELSWDGGASSAAFPRASAYNYTEAYLGLASENLSGRIYYSPSYFNQKARTVYAEINATYGLRENVHLLGHFGMLHPIAGNGPSAFDAASRYDGRVGISARYADWVAEVAWVAVQKTSAYYPTYADRNPHAVVVSVSFSF
jgi:uncharacterized protein (TIGR02001 family)